MALEGESRLSIAKAVLLTLPLAENNLVRCPPSSVHSILLTFTCYTGMPSGTRSLP